MAISVIGRHGRACEQKPGALQHQGWIHGERLPSCGIDVKQHPGSGHLHHWALSSASTILGR
jgi:hypothetical protein